MDRKLKPRYGCYYLYRDIGKIAIVLGVDAGELIESVGYEKNDEKPLHRERQCEDGN
jgi:hypothetical protein